MSSDINNTAGVCFHERRYKFRDPRECQDNHRADMKFS